MVPTKRMSMLLNDLVYNKEYTKEDGGTFEFAEDVPNGGIYSYTETDAEGNVIEDYIFDPDVGNWIESAEYIQKLAKQAPANDEGLADAVSYLVDKK